MGQHGLITRQQAVACGFSTSAIDRRLAAGRWLLVHQGVYLVAGSPRTYRMSLLAACLASGGVASHRSAAHLHGLDGFRPGPPEISVPAGTRCLRGQGRIHESTDLHLAPILTIDGIPVTGLLRLAVDLGGVVSFERLSLVLDELVRRGCSWEELYTSLVRHARRGRTGVGALRAALEERFGERVADSALERAFEARVADAGLPLPHWQVEIFDAEGFVARVDYAYVPERIVIEVDSVAHHLNIRSFSEDPRKRNRLALGGWLVIEVTHRLLVDEPWVIVGQIRHALRERSAPLPKSRHLTPEGGAG
jgi:hypothetical protein